MDIKFSIIDSIPEFERLIKELFNGGYSKKFTEEQILRILKQENLHIFTEVRDSHIVGMTTLYVMELLSRKVAVIEEVVSLTEYRNKGIGSRLVKNAIDKARKLGCDFVELTVREDKPEVQKFYEKLKFVDRHNKAMRLKL